MQPDDFVYEIPDTRTSRWLETVSTCSAKGAIYGKRDVLRLASSGEGMVRLCSNLSFRLPPLPEGRD